MTTALLNRGPGHSQNNFVGSKTLIYYLGSQLKA